MGRVVRAIWARDLVGCDLFHIFGALVGVVVMPELPRPAACSVGGGIGGKRCQLVDSVIDADGSFVVFHL